MRSGKERKARRRNRRRYSSSLLDFFNRFTSYKTKVVEPAKPVTGTEIRAAKKLANIPF